MPINVIELCSRYHIKMSKEKGQNFLMNSSVLQDIVNVSKVGKHDRVLEIGPGLGVLTERLAPQVKKVLTVELDDMLYGIVKKELASFNNIHIIHNDILQIKNNEIKSLLYDKSDIQGDYHIVANIPYSITSLIIRKFTEEPSPKTMTLLVQKEVGERLASIPGKHSILSISTQLYYDVHVAFVVPRSDFYPKPAVDSIVMLFNKNNQYISLMEEKGISEYEFFKIVKMGFSQKRKKLVNNLNNGFHLKGGCMVDCLGRVGLDSNIRAQNLSISEWISLILELKHIKLL